MYRHSLRIFKVYSSEICIRILKKEIIWLTELKVVGVPYTYYKLQVKQIKYSSFLKNYLSTQRYFFTESITKKPTRITIDEMINCKMNFAEFGNTYWQFLAYDSRQ